MATLTIFLATDHRHVVLGYGELPTPFEQVEAVKPQRARGWRCRMARHGCSNLELIMPLGGLSKE